MSHAPTVERTRDGVYATFALAGLLFASFVTRLPDIRSSLDLSNGSLGLLLFTGSLGSLVTLPLTGRVVERIGAAATVRLGGAVAAAGLVVIAFGATSVEVLALAGLGLFLQGVGVSLWDVSMNVEGAEVERRLGYTIMPRFHAAWSMGSILGSAIGIPMAALSVPVLLHVSVVCAVGYGAVLVATGVFLPTDTHGPTHAGGPTRIRPWRERRTLLIGVMVLAFAMVEGSANDWLSLGFIDGYDVEHWVGVTAFSVFVISMTSGRIVGPLALDRYGRAPLLWASTAAAFVGILITVFAGSVALAFVGVVIWGLGSALGFPVGMSAAADDPIGAAKRVGVVSTIGYGAFLVGPPLLGWVGDRIGTLESLLVVALLMIPAALSVFAVRTPPEVSPRG